MSQLVPSIPVKRYGGGEQCTKANWRLLIFVCLSSRHGIYFRFLSFSSPTNTNIHTLSHLLSRFDLNERNQDIPLVLWIDAAIIRVEATRIFNRPCSSFSCRVVAVYFLPPHCKLNISHSKNRFGSVMMTNNQQSAWRWPQLDVDKMRSRVNKEVVGCLPYVNVPAP